MNNERIEIGDPVRIVNYLTNENMPVGIVKKIDGAYIYVDVENPDLSYHHRVPYEVYANEIVKITKQEYFKLILSGANVDPNG